MTAFDWVKDKLLENNDDRISSVEIENNFLLVIRKNGKSLKAIDLNEQHITLEQIKNRISNDKNIDFILTSNNNVVVEGKVYPFLKSKEISIGDFKDLFRVINQEDNFPYINPTVEFINTGLRQHNGVSSFRRLNNQTYLVERFGKESLTMTFLLDYNLNAESVRNAIERFNNFQILLKANPNPVGGKEGISKEALNIAKQNGIEILKWAAFYSRLNR